MASFAGISVLLHHLRRKQTPLKYAAFLRGNTVMKLDAVRYFSIDTKRQSENIKDEWYLSAAVCVERIPTLTPPLSQFEQTMIDHLSQREYENSKKSDFEIRQEADIEAAEKRKQEGTKLSTGSWTAQDNRDYWIKDREAFQSRPRLTRADKTIDLTSPDRELDTPLHLVMERNLGYINNPREPYFAWDLPTSIRREGESMRQTAERAIKDHCGNEFDVHILGNAPWSYYKVKYPKRIQDITGRRGEKTFLYKAQYKSGRVNFQENISRSGRWLNISELDIISPEIKNTLLQILYNNNIDCS